MSSYSDASDAMELLEDALISQMGESRVAPNILIECYREGDHFEFTVYADDVNLMRLGSGRSLIEAALAIKQPR